MIRTPLVVFRCQSESQLEGVDDQHVLTVAVWLMVAKLREVCLYEEGKIQTN